MEKDFRMEIEKRTGKTARELVEADERPDLLANGWSSLDELMD